MQRPDRATLWAVCRFLALLVVLIVPWPGMGRPVARAFGYATQTMLAPVLATVDTPVVFQASDETDAQHEWDLLVLVKDPKTSATLRHASVHVRRSGYLQVACFLAFVAGWPGRSPRRLAFVLGLGLACLACLTTLPVLMFLSRRGVVPLAGWLLSTLAVAYRALVTAPGMAFAVPAILWCLLARPIDWTAFVEGARSVARLPESASRKDRPQARNFFRYFARPFDQ